MKKIVLIIAVLFLSMSLFAQTEDKEALKTELSDIKSQIKALEKKASAVQTKIDNLYGWKVSAFGSIGVNLSGFNNWYANSKPNLSEGNINIVHDVYAKLNREKYFWLSYLNLNLGWKKSYNKDKDTKDKGFENKTDIFKLGSLFGYKLTEKFSLSALMEYRGSFIKDFADPSFVDLGVGMAWNPVKDCYIVVNPLSYEFIFSGNEKTYKSSMGAKFLADYTRQIGKINFKTNVTAFLSYKSMDLSNWTWTNSFSYTLWKKIGLGFNFGLRQNKQEAFNSKITSYPSLKDTDNKLQSFWMFGLSYTL
ncbi:MAG: hypothetical protein CSA15_01930 [Candidatus Delongbacteria bacterium]|nr:MAG: hypothetical protein CSA15_01930 [Candidatus Delongbacteria bacterium]